MAAGDHLAYQEFVRDHRPGMMQLALRLLGDSDLAEEVVQDTFEAVLKDIGRFRGDSSLKTWTYRILFNRAIRVGRRERRTISFSDFEDGRVSDRREPVGVASGAVDPQSHAISRQRLQILAEGLHRLPERQRRVVVLRDVEGWGSQEISELLQITVGNQRVLLHRARAALRAELETRDAGGAPIAA
jgi:RNA polymerase sigma-70 factor (ECF subfamily)